jgi:hypothetical protein
MADAYHAFVAAIQRENRTAAGGRSGHGGQKRRAERERKAGDRDRTGDLNLGKVAL